MLQCITVNGTTNTIIVAQFVRIKEVIQVDIIIELEVKGDQRL